MYVDGWWARGLLMTKLTKFFGLVAILFFGAAYADGCRYYTTASDCNADSGCSWYADNNMCLPKCEVDECIGIGTQCVQTLSASKNYTCITCGGDTPYATESHLECVACEDDTQYIDSDICKTCPDNKMANSTHNACDAGCAPGYVCRDSDCNTCDKCSAGSKCPGGREEEVICPKGSYSEAGQPVCLSCPVGYTTEEEGTTNSEDCKPSYMYFKIGGNIIPFPDSLKVKKTNTSVVQVIQPEY